MSKPRSMIKWLPGIARRVREPRRFLPGTIDHSERLVKECRSVANDLTALAKEHEAMAANVRYLRWQATPFKRQNHPLRLNQLEL